MALAFESEYSCSAPLALLVGSSHVQSPGIVSGLSDDSDIVGGLSED